MKQILTDWIVVAQFPIPIISTEEGTATQVAAAFDPELESNNGAFLEHCKPSKTKEECLWTAGKENADKLWALSEKLIGEEFAY